MTISSVRLARLVAAASIWCLLLAGSAGAAAVQIRVEGSASTTYEAAVETQGRDVKGHKCDGTNLGANPSPGPTLTTALDDGAGPGGYTWTGDWYDTYEDFIVTEIAGEAQNELSSWLLVKNFQVTSAGGCQVQMNPGDEALWAYISSAPNAPPPPLLKLTAPKVAATGEAFQVKVVDGSDGDEAIAGATVGGEVTNANGVATLSYNSPGEVRLKAERAGAVRSNAQVVCIYVPGGDQCGTTAPTPIAPTPGVPGGEAPPDPQGSGDNTAASTGPFERTPPRARIAGLRNRARYRRGPNRIRGTVEERGSGIAQISIRLTRTRRGRCTWYSAHERRFVGRTCRRAEYSPVGSISPWQLRLPWRLGPGDYVLQVRVRDRAGNVDSPNATGRTRVRFRVLKGRRAR